MDRIYGSFGMFWSKRTKRLNRVIQSLNELGEALTDAECRCTSLDDSREVRKLTEEIKTARRASVELSRELKQLTAELQSSLENFRDESKKGYIDAKELLEEINTAIDGLKG